MSDKPPHTSEEYSDASFWQKLKNYAVSAGSETVETALRLYYAMQDEDTPPWAKTAIIGALLYFIVPTDTLPDLLPGGYVDDLGALAAAAWTVANHIKDEHRQKAKEMIDKLFPSNH